MATDLRVLDVARRGATTPWSPCCAPTSIVGGREWRAARRSRRRCASCGAAAAGRSVPRAADRGRRSSSSSGVAQGLPARRARGGGAARRSACASSAGESVAVTGPVGLGEVHAPEHPGLPRPAQPRRVPPGRRARGRPRRRGAVPRCATARIGFVFQSFHLIPQLTVARERRDAAPLRRRAAGASGASGRCAASERVGLAAPRRPPARRAVGRRGAARGDRARAGQRAARCSWPTSRPATSTAPPARRSRRLLDELHREGRTLVVVTHNEAPGRARAAGGAPARRAAWSAGGRRRDAARASCSAWACAACSLHKLRSTLSILGVVFGVAAVMAMSVGGRGRAAGGGEPRSARSASTASRCARGRPPAHAGAGLRLRDAEAVRRVVPGLLAVAPVREARCPRRPRAARADAVVVGTTPAYQAAARLRLASGRFLSRPRRAGRASGWRCWAPSVAARALPVGRAARRARLGGRRLVRRGGRARGARRGPRPPGPIRTRDVNRAVFVPLPALDRGGRRAPGRRGRDRPPGGRRPRRWPPRRRPRSAVVQPHQRRRGLSR